MKIKERLRNKVFITSLAAFIIMIAKQFNLFYVPDNWEEIFNAALGLLIMLGIIVDPTSPGISDRNTEEGE